MSGCLFAALSPEAGAGLERLLRTIEETFPVPSRHRSALPRDVAQLSRELTSGRSDRDGGYLGKPAELSAYLRCFLPWNVFRLCRLLPSLPLSLSDGDAVVDLGSGPLTVPIALYLSRPELRGLKLEFRCLDRTGKVLEAGAALFAALCDAEPCAWRMRTIRGPLGTRIEGPKAALVTAANVLNELFWDDRRPVAVQAERTAGLLSALARGDGDVLVVEPGIPRSGEFVSALRGALLPLWKAPAAPCPHAGDCPLPGGRRGAKWCHFAFDTEEAPERLRRLSAAAGLPKERATLSFLLASGRPRSEAAPGGRIAVRVLSDAFPLGGGRLGRYGCSPKGLALVSGGPGLREAAPAGSLLSLAPSPDGRRDEKSGALLLDADARQR